MLFACAGNSEKNEASDDDHANKKLSANYQEQESKQDSMVMVLDTEKFANMPDTVALKQTAVQKLQDLFGYLEIFANKKYDKEFRYEAKKQVMEMFNDTDNTAIFDYPKKGEIKLKAALDFILNNEADSMRFEVSDISLNFLLHKDTCRKFEGAINYRLHIYSFKNKKISKQYYTLTEALNVLWMEKKFGDETEKTWKIFMGNAKATEIPMIDPGGS